MFTLLIFKRIWLLLAVMTLAACGGGGGTSGTAILSDGNGGGSTTTTTTTTPSAANVVLTLSSSTLANNGSQTVTATAQALDSNNSTVTGVPITLGVSSGVATPSRKVTDATGAVSAAIGIGADPSLRTITVTAISGSISRTVTLTVVASSATTGTNPSDLILSLNSPSIAADGSQAVTASVTALDEKRNVLPGVVVSVSANSGATVQPAGTATGANGVLTATVGLGTASLNQTITVQASAGGLTTTKTLTVAAATTPLQPTASDLSLSLSSSQLDNSGGATVTATAIAVDANRNALANIPISFSVDSSAVLVPGALKTDANGVVKAAVGVGSDRSNRVITVVASSGGLTRSLPIRVFGAKLSASLSPVVTAGSGADNVVQYKLADFTGQAMGGQTISVAAAGLPSVSGKTDANGAFTYTYKAPSSSGQIDIVATAAGASLTSSVTSAAVASVAVADTLPQSASLTPTPSVVSVNPPGSTTNQVQLRALFVGINNKPVERIRVRFDLSGNGNSTDGVVSYAGSYAYSDASGVARGIFVPGQIASPTNGVVVRACWSTSDFPADNPCPNAVTTTLTVVSEALSVAIRSGNTLGVGTSNLTYVKQFVVMVVDAAGQAKSGVMITPSVDLPNYYKGQYVYNDVRKRWEQVMALAATEVYGFDRSANAWSNVAPADPNNPQPACPNEDVNRNGVREAGAFDASVGSPSLSARAEDLNWNGSLDPRKADVAVSMVGSSSTDANGLAVIQIEYGKSVATWVDFVITVTAAGISGTEAKAQYSGLYYGIGNLPGLAADLTDQNVVPPFVFSPYGRQSVCSNPN